MKNFLCFILGFIIVFTLVLFTSCYAVDSCTVYIYKHIGTQTGFYNTPTWSCDNLQVCTGVNQGQYGFTDGAIIEGQAVNIFDCGNNTTCYSLGIGSIPRDTYGNLGPLNGWKLIPNSIDFKDYITLNSNGYLKCSLDCSDTDSDGLCDVCDDAPNDSTVGPNLYLKGYYQLANGTVVAAIYSHSSTSTTYDMTTIDHEYNYPDKFKGLNYVLGMPSSIDEKEFFSGGGSVMYLKTPTPLRKYKCNSVGSLDQCTNAICDYDEFSDGKDADDKVENLTDNGDKNFPTTEQKAEDAGLMDLDKTCGDLRSKCASSCGGTTNIKNFACSENEHMVCQCLSNGSWELAKDWSEVGKQITITETTTVPSYGTGDTSSGGGSTTSVNGSSDGSLTGSYGYVEGNINYDTLSSHFSQFNSRFPFSLRSTLGSIYSEFKGSGAAPVYTYSVYGKTVTIDLAAWNDIAKMIRSFFALGITLSTIVLLIYLYVGIDLRGK